MHAEWKCRGCECPTLSESLHDVVERLIESGPFDFVGDCATPEDAIYRALRASQCPECGDSMEMNQKSLNRLARRMLQSW